MSNQNGPAWYPSRQFTHTPDVPGVPASATAPAPTASSGRSRGLRRLLDTLLGKDASNRTE